MGAQSHGPKANAMVAGRPKRRIKRKVTYLSTFWFDRFFDFDILLYDEYNNIE